MKYIVLLRAINVGGKRKVEMKKLKAVFESMGCRNVRTYLNSGNAILESEEKQQNLQEAIFERLKSDFGFEINILVKSLEDIKRITDAIPDGWANDKVQKTDVAFLFPQIDSKDIIDVLPVRRTFLDVRYVKGALFWNVKRKNLSKSHLSKIVQMKQYPYMTIRNVNTTRYLAGCD